MDNLTTCLKCNGDACLEQQIPSENITTYFCFGCGFTTTSISTRQSEIIQTSLQNAPELYKDLAYEDKRGLVWLPATITLPGSGMVFIDGVSTSEWRWAAVKAVPILQEEKDKYPPEQTHKMDMKNVKFFSSQDFMDALEEIGFFNI